MTLANVITLTRLFLIPPILIGLALGQRGVSLALLLAFLAGDVLDGHLARTRREVSELGQFIDPLADKLMTFSLMVWFAWNGELGWWAVALLVIQQGLLLLGSLVLFQRGRSTLPARASGKLAAAVLSLGFVLLYLQVTHAAWMIAIGIALSYLAVVDYCRVAFRARG